MQMPYSAYHCEFSLNNYTNTSFKYNACDHMVSHDHTVLHDHMVLHTSSTAVLNHHMVHQNYTFLNDHMALHNYIVLLDHTVQYNHMVLHNIIFFPYMITWF